MARFFLVLVGLALGGFLFARSLLLPVAPGNTALQSFEVMRGDTPSSLASRLQSRNLIKSALVFRAVVKYEGLGSKIQAGVYQLSSGMGAVAIAGALTHGLAEGIKITIPEGYRNEQIADVLNTKLGISVSAALAAMKGTQGKLFPDTYFVGKDASAEEVVSLMGKTYLDKTASLAVGRDDLTIASLVERETRGDAEKPVVAGILKKRLAAGWPLELDATVQYALGGTGHWWPDTTLADRKVASPYNTYLHAGLPPAPICNPGLPSIQAALHPVDSTFWFYLHDKQGTIHYAATSAEQSANIAKYIY